MAKIMLVEDDNNLREIYEARLLAEGYEIVSAHDGEEALAMAVKEKPDLIISDVMMPKISGFDMLDILRGTPETRNTKVIMMTALSQAEDKTRADSLGADRYLVKSQVTLEDVARVAREVLEGKVVPATDTSSSSAPTVLPPVAEPAAAAPVVAEPVATPTPTPPAASPAATPTQDTPTTDPAPVVAAPPVASEPPAVPDPPADEASVALPDLAAAAADLTSATADPASTSTEAHASEPVSPTPVVETAQSTEAEKETVEDQVEEFVETAETHPMEITVSPDGTILPGTPPAEPATPSTPPELKLPDAQIPVEPSQPVAEVPSAPSLPSMPETGRTMAQAPSQSDFTIEKETDVVTDPTSLAPNDGQAETEATPAPAQAAPVAVQPRGTTAGLKVIEPPADINVAPDLNALLAKEQEKEQVAQILGSAGVAPPPPMPTSVDPGQSLRPSDDSKQDPNMIAL
jgi:CheY-like chemotaxis protein